MQSSIHSYFSVTKAADRMDVDMDAASDVPIEKPDYARLGFGQLPIEINREIALGIDSDDDVFNFRNSCKSAYDCIEHDGCTFWKNRFLANFEKPLGNPTNKQYREVYMARKRLARKGLKFKLGHTLEEEKALEVLKELVLEAYSEKTKENGLIYKSSNIHFIIQFAGSHGLLDCIFSPHNVPKKRTDQYPRPTEPLLQMLQVLLAPCLLGFEFGSSVWRFPGSQQQVYSTTTKRPFFGGCNGLDVDMDLILHHLNFWRYHMIRPEEHTLHGIYSALDEADRPQFWSNQLRKGEKQAIGKRWKGGYAFVRDVVEQRTIRSGGNEDEQIVDEFCGDDDESELQDIDVEIDVNGKEGWNDLFEQYLQSLKKPESRARTRAQRRSNEPDETCREKRSCRFKGTGTDSNQNFLADGWLNPLPPQQDVPGWQRMTMMKYYDDDFGNIDYGSLWAYEGVVLPGGQIIIGRWWSPQSGLDESQYSGPFILWCVDGQFEREQSQQI